MINEANTNQPGNAPHPAPAEAVSVRKWIQQSFAPLMRGTGSMLLILALSRTVSSQAQVLQQWTHQSVIGESSAAVGLDDNYMFVVDNEDEILRLYERFPANSCSAPVYTFNARPYLGLSSSNPENDLEAAVKVPDGNGSRIYWLGSHSNSKSGNLRPNRNRLFATEVSGNGNGSPPYALSHVGRYDHLRADLIAWDQNNLHGKGAHYFGLASSAAAGVISGRIDGFNIEGLVLAPDGATAYLAFRAPLVNGSGATTALPQRTNALIVPLLNMPALVTGSPTGGPGTARFGEPFTLSLGTRGVRSIDSSHPGHYLITAGPPGDPSYPPAAPDNFRVFTWTGHPADGPREQPTEFPIGSNPEGAILPPGPITSRTMAQFVSDDVGGCWRSFLLPVAQPTAPTLQPLPSVYGRARLIINGDAGLNYAVEASTDLINWTTLSVIQPSSVPFTFTDPDPTHSSARFYRVRLGP